LSNLWSKLNPRERKVAELLLLGCDQAEIAKKLNLARRTVKEYYRRMFVHAEISDFTGIKQVKLVVMLYRERHQFDSTPHLQQYASLTLDRVNRKTEIHIPIVSRPKEADAASLQQQIAELYKLTADQQAQIKSLREQIEANSAAALQAKVDPHTLGVEQGAGFGRAGALFLGGSSCSQENDAGLHRHEEGTGESCVSPSSRSSGSTPSILQRI
jgi:hypothetical protein